MNSRIRRKIPARNDVYQGKIYATFPRDLQIVYDVRSCLLAVRALAATEDEIGTAEMR
jgi:hypothetical protein